MARGAEAAVWWADVEEVKERIERRRASERRVAERIAAEDRRVVGRGSPYRPSAVRRTVSITGRPSSPVAASGLRLVGERERTPAGPRAARPRRPRPRPVDRIGGRPDRIAAWAVVMGFLLILAAVLSAHG